MSSRKTRCVHRLSIIVIVWFVMAACGQWSMGQERPNFVVINIDDLGYGDIGPFGSQIKQTPALDRMAKEGRKLLSHYGAVVCSPSRASLMTGCYPKRALPIGHVLFPASAIGLHPSERTVAEVLKDAGYATACIGKWHLGDQPEFLPTRQGFDYYFGLPYSNDMGTAADGSKSSVGQPLPKPNKNAQAANQAENDGTGLRGNQQPPLPLLENEKVIERVRAAEQLTLTARYTDKAIDFIKQNASRPFFLYLPHTAVHFPHYPSPEFRGKSKGGLNGDWVQEVDMQVGRLLDVLRETGLDRKTLVLFTSDNGGPTGQGGINTPLRGSKGQTFEGGIRVPTIAWWPGKIEAGSETRSITSMMDVLPTFAKLANAKTPDDRRIDGEDIWSILSGQERDRTFYYFRGLELEAVRHGKWKLHLARKELFDLEANIAESENVYDKHDDVVKRLTALAEELDKDLGMRGIGPGCRQLGRVDNAQPLIPRDQ